MTQPIPPTSPHSTYFALLCEYGTAHIPLEKICEKFFGLTPKQAARDAAASLLPVPAYRAGSQRSPFIVDAVTFANYLDKLKKESHTEWRKVHY